uniref:Uncharacterized protein n=1 Tax=Aegilops tauschii subsp. strangulata TaxID=200361 RepID=A0A452ZF99_AEGTS
MRRCFLASSFRRQMHARHCHGGSDPDAPSWFLVASPPGFIYTLLSLGIIMCLLTCSGRIAAEAANSP